MRRGQLWVGVVAAALVATSGTAQAAPVSGATTTDAVPAVAVAAAADAVAGAADAVAGAMHVLPARRVLDTRSGLGAAKGTRSGGSTTTVSMLGTGGVPASGVGAVLLHVTVTGATGNGHVTTYPGGTALPTASTLNVVAGQNITNMTVVPVGAAGTVSLRYTGSGTVNLVADVAGFTTAGAPTEAGTTGTLAPARLMDTRTGLGGRTGALPSGGLAHLQVTGRGGVPAQAGSVTLNVTVVTPSNGGWLAVTPTDPGAGKVTTSSLNFVPGKTIANAVTTALSPTGTIDLRLSTGTTAHVVVDVLAWTVPGTPTTDGTLQAHAPTRILDTRAGSRPSTGAALEVDAGGTGGVVLNVTAVGASSPGYVTVSGSGVGTPNSSQLSFPATSARAALVYVPGTSTGKVRLTLPSSGAHLVVDEVATLTGPLLGGSTPAAVTDPVGSESTTTGTRLTWTAAADTASVMVRRKTTGTPRSPYDGTSVFTGPGSATGFDDRTAEPWHTYHYAVFARDALGNYSEAARTDATAAPLRWTSGGRVSKFYGRPIDVSCPTTSWCLAVGEFGHSWVWSGGAWAASGSVDPPDTDADLEFSSVSCPTTSFCLATLHNGRLATWQSGTWTATPQLAKSYGDVSCWSSTGCGLTVASGSSLEFERWTNGALEGGVAISGRSGAFALSCPTSTCSFLTRTSTSVYVHRVVAGGSPTSKSLGSGYQGELSCVSATWCLAVVDGQYRTGYGTSWSSAKAASTSTGAPLFVTMDLSCPTQTSCTLVGVGGGAEGAGALRWNGSTWSLTNIGAGLNTDRAVDCASSSACMVVDVRGRFTRWAGSSWTSRATFTSSGGGFNSLDCTSASTCLATDWYGNALEWSGGSTWPRTNISEGGSWADCAGSTCMTVDLREWTWRTRSDGTWGATHRDGRTPVTPPLCPSSTRCFSLSGDGYLQWDGRQWSTDYRALPLDVGRSENGGDCPTSTFCLAVGTGGRTVSWNGSRWSARPAAPFPAGSEASVDCVSASFCMAVSGGSSAVLTPSGWHVQPDTTYGLASVACRSTSLCLAMAGNVLMAWDGRVWSPTETTLGDGMWTALIRCAGTTRCVVAAGEQIWWTS